MRITTQGLVLVCCMCSCCVWTESASKERLNCADPANTDVCFEPTVVYRVALQAGETAILRCVIRNLNKQVVTWMRNDGRDIPMTIGKTVFTPDARVSLDNSIADEWNLVIRQAEIKDSGEYLCQVNGKNGLLAQSYGLEVEESATSSAEKSDQKGDKRLLSDDQESRSRGKSLSVSISGEGTVFEGTQYFPLTCTARFGSRDAKLSPQVAIEWYHQGMRQSINVSSMDISMSWADSDRAISVLTIYRVRMSHTGEWVCLKRPSEQQGSMETATHSLTVLARESTAAKARSAADAVPASSAGLGIHPEVPAAPSSSDDIGGAAAVAAPLPGLFAASIGTIGLSLRLLR